jgi:hypothetical protein
VRIVVASDVVGLFDPMPFALVTLASIVLLGGMLVAGGWAAAAVALTGSGRAATAARRRLRSRPAPG